MSNPARLNCQCHEYHAYGYPCIQCQLEADMEEHRVAVQLATDNGMLVMITKQPGDHAEWFDGPGWYFPDETLWLHGPFESKETCFRALDGYCRQLNGWLTQ